MAGCSRIAAPACVRRSRWTYAGAEKGLAAPSDVSWLWVLCMLESCCRSGCGSGSWSRSWLSPEELDSWWWVECCLLFSALDPEDEMRVWAVASCRCRWFRDSGRSSRVGWRGLNSLISSIMPSALPVLPLWQAPWASVTAEKLRNTTAYHVGLDQL